MKKPRPKLIATIVIIIVLLAFANVWFFIHSVDNTVDWLGDRVSAVEREQAKQKEQMSQEVPAAPINTVTTITNPAEKGDKGDTGAPGKDSVSTHTIEREVIVKEVPAPAAPVIELRCNVAKNRWEMRYTGDESWKVLNDEPVPCTINADILTQLYLNLRKE